MRSRFSDVRSNVLDCYASICTPSRVAAGKEALQAFERAFEASGTRKCATPDFSECADAPPRSSCVMSSCVTVFTTAGPVTYRHEASPTV